MHILKSFIFFSHNIFFVAVGIVGIGFLIGFHELGHFLMCKLFKVRTPSFSIGMGPKLISKKIGETEFSISAIPLGGYVEIAGQAEIGQGEQKEAKSTDPHSFNTKPWYQKVLIMLGGILFNLIFAYGALSMLFMSGIPKTEFLYPFNAKPVIANIEKESAAEKAGLLVGDTIIAINETATGKDVKALMEKTWSMPGQKTTVTIERDSKQKNISVLLDTKKHLGRTLGSLGVIYEIAPIAGSSFIESVKRGIRLTNFYIVTFVGAFKHIFTKGDVEQVAGPIAIIKETVRGVGLGFKIFLLFLALMSVNLAVLNLIPLPILDGGQVLFVTIEAIIRRPIPEKIREYIHIASWLMVMLLILYFSYKDVRRMISPYLQKIFK